MNAYDLAEKLTESDIWESADYLQESAQMLRQQAKRIEELEKLPEYVFVCKRCGDDLGIKTDDLNKLYVPHELSDEEILKLAVGELDCVDEEHIKRFAMAIIKASRGEE